MKWPTKPKEPHLIEVFKKQPLFLGKKKGKVPVMNFMRGNPEAKILCIAPPPTEEEYQLELPLSGQPAKVLHNILAMGGVNTQEDMLVVSCSRFGVKPSKASCSPIVDLLKQAAKSQQFDLYVCIGDAAFKHIFAQGRKANMQTLVGNLVYLKELDHVPLFTFPNLDGLVITIKDAPAATWRWHNKCVSRMEKIAAEFFKIRKLLVKK